LVRRPAMGGRSSREVLAQGVADVANGIHQRVGELLVSEMVAHFLDEALPQLIAAFLMDRFVADDGELVGARRHPDQNVVVVRVFVEPETMKSFLRGDERIAFYLAALNKTADLARRFRFCIADRLHNRVVLEFAEKFFRAHFRYQLEPPPPPPKLPPPPLNPLNPPPSPPPEDQPPPPPPNLQPPPPLL